MEPKTFKEIRTILNDVACELGGIKYEFFLGTKGDEFYLQLRYIEADVETGEATDQHGRKWMISPFMTKSEIVQTALKACLTSAEHVVREHFMYKGERIFGPHFDVEELHAIAKERKHDIRIPPKK